MANEQADISQMKVPNGKQLVFADGVPKFPPKVAYSLVKAAVESCPKALVVYDPFCGNGTNLLAAGMNFPAQFIDYYGSDINPNAVQSTRINLSSQLEDMPTEEVERNVFVADATTDFLPHFSRLGDRLVVVTDPPFGRRCVFDGDRSLAKAFQNFHAKGAGDIFFCYDDKTPLPKEISPQYKVREFLHAWDRSFYHAKAR